MGTALLMEAISQLRTAGTVNFTLVHVNAMRLGTPSAVFGNIASQLPLNRSGGSSTAVARGDLNRFFSDRGKSDPVVLLLVDEIDHLVTSNQAVLYRIFDWVALPRARLVTVAISNTMDLPERLIPRVASRFDIVRVDFQPYDRAQLTRILCERLQAFDATEAFSEITLKLCAARVAAGSGDIRKALQVCRGAVEARLRCLREDGPVGIQHLETAMRDLLHASPAVKAITGLGLKARRFLTAFFLETRRLQQDSVPLRSIAERYGKLIDLSIADAELSGFTPGDVQATEFSNHADDAEFLLKRLEGMSLLTKHDSWEVDAAGTFCALGPGLDSDDLVAALLASETDEAVKELVQDKKNGA